MTPLSARAIALYLVSQDDPERSLCPHKRTVTPHMEDEAIKSQTHSRAPTPTKSKSSSDTGKKVVIDVEEAPENTDDVTVPASEPAPDNVNEATISASEPAPEGVDVSAEETVGAQVEEKDRGRSHHSKSKGKRRERRKRTQAKKDPKSLEQNLFDTSILHALETYHLADVGSGLIERLAPEGTESRYPSAVESIREARHGKVSHRRKHSKYLAVPDSRSHALHEVDTDSVVEVDGEILLSNGEAATVQHEQQEAVQGGETQDLDPSLLPPPPPIPPPPPSHSPAIRTVSDPISPGQVASVDTIHHSVGDSSQDPDKKTRSTENIEIPTSTRHHTSKRNHKHSRRSSHTKRSARDLEHGGEFIKPPQTLRVFRTSTAVALVNLLQQKDPLNEQQRHFLVIKDPSNLLGRSSSATSYHKVLSFLEQSIFYVFGDIDSIADSFISEDEPLCDHYETGIMHKWNSFCLRDVLANLKAWRNDLVCNSLWLALEPLFAVPSELMLPKSPKLRAVLNGGNAPVQDLQSPSGIGTESLSQRIYSDDKIAYTIFTCICALSANFPMAQSLAFADVQWARASGERSRDRARARMTRTHVDWFSFICDAFDKEGSLRLASRLMRVVAARAHYHEVMLSKATAEERKGKYGCGRESPIETVIQLLKQSLKDFELAPFEEHFPDFSIPLTFVEWARTLLINDWDGKEEVSRSGVVGSCLSVLQICYDRREELGLEDHSFQLDPLASRMDILEVPAAWVKSARNPKTLHVLSFPFLFSPSVTLSFFRAINYSKMSSAVEASLVTDRLISTMSFAEPVQNDRSKSLRKTLKTALDPYFVLEIRRNNVLVDALDGLWRRERRELLRPLKVRMGMSEGEEGVDHGGVQQEFFRVAIAEALNPAYGLFTEDSISRITWFKPLSLEPLFKFELLGLLFSLAIYNGVTLPVNFPLALYRKLLEKPVSEITHIHDGWPMLAKGLKSLLGWTDGDVGDVFVRTYEYSFPHLGKIVNIDMLRQSLDDFRPPDMNGATRLESKHHRLTNGKVKNRNLHTNADSSIDADESSNVEADLVTNSNRESYVKDYIAWLTDKSIAPQFEAFSRGFFVCVSRKALSIFTPETLQLVIEGRNQIRTKELKACTKYEEPLTDRHPLVKRFWTVVKGFTLEQRRRLLEFVTASDRMPAHSDAAIITIQRNGPSSERIPTSMTCFGRLLLPEYESVDVLRSKMLLALENSNGFGVA